jgi:hypothetical protein
MANKEPTVAVTAVTSVRDKYCVDDDDEAREPRKSD